jgi:hypothetical protein
MVTWCSTAHLVASPESFESRGAVSIESSRHAIYLSSMPLRRLSGLNQGKVIGMTVGIAIKYLFRYDYDFVPDSSQTPEQCHYVSVLDILHHI